MKALTTLEIVIIIIIIIVAVLFVLSWLGLVQNPFDWAKRQTIKNRFCQELTTDYRCNIERAVIVSGDVSRYIKKRDIGINQDDFATFGEICIYLGYRGSFENCIKTACGCIV